MLNKNCLFTSIGDDIFLVNFIKNQYPDYDIICNYYGSNNKTLEFLQKTTKYAEKNYSTKFPTLKKMYSRIVDYDYVIVFDDDAKLIKGNLDDIIQIMQKYDLAIASPAHDAEGKISYSHNRPQIGQHIFRYVNFIEMNFPIFSDKALYKYIKIYDGVLLDWGNDIFYSHILNCDKIYNAAIIDDVVVHNPKNSNRANNFMSNEASKNQWFNYKKERGLPLSMPQPKTLEYYYA